MNDNPPTYEEVIEGKVPPSAPYAPDVDGNKASDRYPQAATVLDTLLNPEQPPPSQEPPESIFICDREYYPDTQEYQEFAGSEVTHDHRNYPPPRLPEDGPPTSFLDKIAFLWDHCCPAFCSGREMNPRTKKLCIGWFSKFLVFFW